MQTWKEYLEAHLDGSETDDDGLEDWVNENYTAWDVASSEHTLESLWEAYRASSDYNYSYDDDTELYYDSDDLRSLRNDWEELREEEERKEAEELKKKPSKEAQKISLGESLSFDI